MSEFDKFAKDYKGALSVDTARLLSKNEETLFRNKVFWIYEKLLKNKKTEDISILDFGCGSGDFIFFLKQKFNSINVVGCEVSQKMINEARKRYKKLNIIKFNGRKLNLENESFDYICLSCVLHHIELNMHNAIILELKRLLKPNGVLVIFEHNLINPVTKHIVNNCQLDINAHFFRVNYLKKLLKEHNFVSKIYYILFFPPRLKLFWKLEKYLHWVPLGGQYICITYKR